MIERKAKVTVNEWITHGNDAFLLTGARQIGKTYLIRQCLKESGYPYIEFNFIEQPELVNLFAGAKDAKELLMRLSVVAKEPLEQGKTIIFLDEIQEFKDIVTRIKFLVEDGTFRYIMSGSLLGVELNAIEKGMSYDRLKNDFLWLKDAGVAIPVYNISEPKLPLIVSENRNLFKLFFSDVGLLTSCYSNQVKLAILNKEKAINNGALFENVVAQELLAKGHKEYYFNSKQQGELDFVIELDGKVVPLEIKSGKDYKRHSALNNVLKNENYKIKEAYILSEGNIEIEGKRVYLPIYMIMFLENTELKNTIYKIDLGGLGE